MPLVAQDCQPLSVLIRLSARTDPVPWRPRPAAGLTAARAGYSMSGGGDGADTRSAAVAVIPAATATLIRLTTKLSLPTCFLFLF